MAKRHTDALGIQEGACNPSGICKSIREACSEVFDERGTPTEDVAVRLMVHQLAFICGVDAIDSDYRTFIAECKEAAGKE